jgi:hypothetical protein
MPRRQTIPAYRLHVQSGLARVILNGRHIYLGRFDSPESRAAYDQLVRKLLTERASAEIEARALISKDLTVAEVAAAYLKFARVYYTKNGRVTTEYNHIVSAVKAVTDRHSHELVTQFGPLKLKQIRADWVAAALVRRQINKRMDRIKRMIGWAVEEEHCPASVHHALKSILGLKKGRRADTQTFTLCPRRSWQCGTIGCPPRARLPALRSVEEVPYGINVDGSSTTLARYAAEQRPQLA